MIDVHAHLGGTVDREMPTLDAEALLAQMDRFGIEEAVVGSTLATEHSPAQGNRELMAMLSSHPRLRPRWEILPSVAEEGAGLDAVHIAREHNVSAFEMHPRRHGYHLLAKEVAPVLTAIEESSCPLLLDRDQAEWDDIEAIAGVYPALTVIVSAVGYRELRRLASVLQRHPHVYVDMVNFSSHQGVEWITESFPDRLLFATGAPGRDPGEAITRLLLAGINSEVQSRVARGTALSLLPLLERAA